MVWALIGKGYYKAFKISGEGCFTNYYKGL